MKPRIRIFIIMVLFMSLSCSACGAAQPAAPTPTPLPTLIPTPAIQAGDYQCRINVTLKDATDILIVKMKIAPDLTIGNNWSITDVGTGSTTNPGGTGQGTLTGNTLKLDLSGASPSYLIHATFVTGTKLSDDYTVDYGSEYGTAADKFECDLTPVGS